MERPLTLSGTIIRGKTLKVRFQVALMWSYKPLVERDAETRAGARIFERISTLH
jgi:hypothetical protein